MAKVQRVSVFRSAVEKIEEQKPVSAEAAETSVQEKVIASEEKIKTSENNENFDFFSEKINRFLVTLIKMT